MAKSRLHINCGTCGNNEDLTFEIERDFDDMDGVWADAVSIYCPNCSTIHPLNEHLKEENQVLRKEGVCDGKEI